MTRRHGAATQGLGDRHEAEKDQSEAPRESGACLSQLQPHFGPERWGIPTAGTEVSPKAGAWPRGQRPSACRGSGLSPQLGCAPGLGVLWVRMSQPWPHRGVPADRRRTELMCAVVGVPLPLLGVLGDESAEAPAESRSHSCHRGRKKLP